MAEAHRLLYAPRARKDLQKVHSKVARQILDDLERLAALQKHWPTNQIKRLSGHPYWEIKTGDYRSIFLIQGKKVVVLRVVNRRELEREIRRIDWRWLSDWLSGR